MKQETRKKRQGMPPRPNERGSVQIDDNTSVSGLIEALKDKSNDRFRAARALARKGLGSKDFWNIVRMTWEEGSWEARQGAVRAIGEIGEYNADERVVLRAVNLLAKVLKEDKNQEVRGMAAWSIGWIGQANPRAEEVQKCIPALEAAAQDKNASVRDAAESALRNIQEESTCVSRYGM